MKPNATFDERWLRPGGVVPVDPVTTGLLIREVQRLRSTASETLPTCKICGVQHGKVADIDYDCPHQSPLQDALVMIDSWIQRGDLGGDGCDKNATRNGMVLAYNLVYALRHGQEQEFGPHRDDHSPEATASAIAMPSISPEEAGFTDHWKGGRIMRVPERADDKDGEMYPYRLHEGDVVDSKGRRITVAGNAWIVNAMNALHELRSTRSATPIPEGWKLVPIQPTAEMMQVGYERGAAGEYNEGIWKAMLDVSPRYVSPPVTEKNPPAKPLWGTGWLYGNNYKVRGKISESKGSEQGEPWYEAEDGMKWSSFDVRYRPDDIHGEVK